MHSTHYTTVPLSRLANYQWRFFVLLDWSWHCCRFEILILVKCLLGVYHTHRLWPFIRCVGLLETLLWTLFLVWKLILLTDSEVSFPLLHLKFANRVFLLFLNQKGYIWSCVKSTRASSLLTVHWTDKSLGCGSLKTIVYPLFFSSSSAFLFFLPLHSSVVWVYELWNVQCFCGFYIILGFGVFEIYSS